MSTPGVNGLIRSYPPERTTLDLIDAQVARIGQQTAVVYGIQSLTYAQLDEKANEFAATLLREGARPGQLLPVLVADGLELPLTILAAMKTGIPFVPFDPRWPAERINDLLSMLGTDLLVAGPRTPSEATADGRAIRIDAGLLAGAPERPAVARPDRHDVFYGFFTSGSTGAPKCTLNHHLGLLNRFTTMTRMFGGGHTSLQNSRSVFDSSLWQLLWPLTSGGRVVMPVREGLLDLEQTVRQIGQHGVTITDFVPSIFTVLADLVQADPELARCASTLRRVLLGGEAINPDAVRRFHEVLPHVVFTNTYGPTEASIGSVFHTFAEPPPQGVEIPIGQPIDNTCAVVVDEQLQPVPIGQTGELLIGGVCVGLGYLGNAERTARAFVDNPFAHLVGDRLYRTGDLVSQRSDGLFYFVGRVDDQIKLRGVRIEPTEVENALLRLPGIQDVKVVVSGTLDRAQLVAAVITDQPLSSILLDHARAVLPPELVPDRFVRFEIFPLSGNGKTDRRALAAAVDHPEVVPASTLPDDGTEARIERLWGMVLPGPVGGDADASFFELGGTSLSAQRLALALRDEFSRHLTVRDIANFPTVRLQAAFVDSQNGAFRDRHTEILSDIELDPWCERRDEPLERPDHILLTGATGFVGAHLIESLLLSTTASITCLVRASSHSSAQQRLAARLDYYDRPDALADPRVRVLVGDLGLPRFGLTDEQYATLAGSVDAIVHAGAEVNLVTPYRPLRATNVLGTRELIGLARIGRRKVLHHLSTLSVLPSGAAVDEDTCLVDTALPDDGYSQSKWAAEKLLSAARDQGLPVSVYRLGEVMPHSGTGIVSHTGSLTELLLETCRMVGAITSTGAVSDFDPVDAIADFVARAVADSPGAQPLGDCYHVVGRHNLALDEVLGRLRELEDLEVLDYRDFRARVQSASSAATAPSAVSKVAMVLPDEPVDPQAPLAPLFFSSTASTFGARFAARCVEVDFDWPPVAVEVLTGWCRSGRSYASPLER